ncbi:MAG: mono/diheme cytochrome c family protein [Kiritimatiellia bacterium]|jgi:mono/diheme cytochrome c family protein
MRSYSSSLFGSPKRLDWFASVLVIALAAVTAPAEDPSEGEKLFALKIKPLFAEKCNACHGDDPEKLKGGFDMRTRDSLIQGGEEFGEVLLPGDGENSYLYILTTRTEEDFEMPPKETDKLSEEQTLWIRDWIDAGAPWPGDNRVSELQEQFAKGERVPTSKALSDDWQKRRYETAKLWAYRPLKLSEVPEGQHPIDWFIDQRLAEKKLEPAPPAAPRELARRMSFGFTGLPPNPEAVDAFVAAYADHPKQAVEKYAHELMSSRHYGERFGLHWLDVARYADSAGFANDYARPNAWRYRDYVVRAFNEDKSYFDFVREQLAGDEIDDNDPEHLIATGFLRMGAWEQTAMSVFRETRQLWLDDITDAVGQAFLAHPLMCAKCHDHKFDPIPTRDFYSVMAVFSTTQFTERPAPFLDEENQAGFARSDQWVNAKVAAYRKQNSALNERVKQNKKTETSEAKIGDNGLDPGDEASQARMQKNIARHQLELDRSKPLALSVYTGNTIERNNVKSRIDLPENPWAKGAMEPDAILAGGNAYSPTDPVQPAALSAAESLGEMRVSTFPDGKGPRRLALADWIVHPRNPLSARVMVNRVWTWHFGKGLAGNPNNFGGTGSLPTHPELLDYLANWFIQHGGSVKQLNDLIASSATYQRSSRHPDPALLAERDPKQETYASFLSRRLSAEELRDAMLFASGELNPTIGGIPCRPDINMEVAMQPRQIMGGTASVYEPNPLPRQRNRRSIYAEKLRGLRDPFMEAFNQPGPDKSCEFRETSTVAPQALTLFNAEEVHERALALAARLLKEGDSEKEIVQRAFADTLGRPATAAEQAMALAHWEKATREESTTSYETRSYPSQIERTVMAEKTGEPYTFTEQMPAYETYVPDLQPTDVDARTRGLAQLCLVLFNLNEFAYLD